MTPVFLRSLRAPRHVLLLAVLTCAGVTSGLAALAPISGRSGHSAVYDPERDRMIVFGGDDGEFRNDVWALHFSMTPPWTEVHAAGQAPSGRTGGRTIYDAGRGRMLVVGGWDAGPNNDVWSLSLTNRPAWSQLNPGGITPAPCGSCPIIVDETRDRVIMISDAVYALSLSDNLEWTQLGGAPPDVTVRYHATAAYDPVRDRVLVFGGDDGNYPLPNDVWALSLSGTPSWTPLTPGGAAPAGRYGATAIYDPFNDRMIFFGGSDTYRFFDDTWALSLSGSPAWTELSPNGGRPAGRALHSAVHDTARGRMVIFGGADDPKAGTDRNDVWALSLDESPVWTQTLGMTEARRASTGHSMRVMTPF
jgi:hypothetical protein